MYDAALGRFHTIDPVAENFDLQTPYAYAANNPVLLVDYNGEGPIVNFIKLSFAPKIL